MNNFRRKRRLLGMTLPEVLIVISIIVVLALVIFWFLRNQVLKGNDAKRKGDIHKIQVAVEEYEKDYDCYPPVELVVCDPGDGLKPYLSKIPCDPTTGGSYYYEQEGSACPSWYRIYANLENLSDADIEGYCGPDYAFNYYVTSPNAPDPDCTEEENGNGGEDPTQDFYGCFSGTCLRIDWDPERPESGGPECDPNYLNSTCSSSGQYFCINEDTGDYQNECQPW
jgi:prepilin-type N-terminal cleavage/methylation domain-containing protein